MRRVVQAQVVETGLSFILTFDYNKFKELFQNKKEPPVTTTPKHIKNQHAQIHRQNERIHDKNGFGFLWLPVMFYSCSETKSLEEGQYLYNGAKINIKANPPISRRKTKELKTELNSLLRPKPNGSFLGIKVKLLLYNLAGKPTGKGLRSFYPG